MKSNMDILNNDYDEEYRKEYLIRVCCGEWISWHEGMLIMLCDKLLVKF